MSRLCFSLAAACLGKVMPQDLANSVFGDEFACVHNQDSSNFMNESKVERLILQFSNNDVPMSWDLLDETGSHIVEEAVEDEDQGPSKEWGPYRWYRHPITN